MAPPSGLWMFYLPRSPPDLRRPSASFHRQAPQEALGSRRASAFFAKWALVLNACWAESGAPFWSGWRAIPLPKLYTISSNVELSDTTEQKNDVSRVRRTQSD